MKRLSQNLAAIAAALLWASALLAPVSVDAAQKARTPSVKAKAQTSRSSNTTTTRKRSSKPSAARPRPTPPPAKPDRTVYLAAKGAEARLRASPRLKAKASEWEKVTSAYRSVVSRYPRSSYCDDALQNAGNLQREMARIFKSRKYADLALDSYGLIVSEYPGSKLGEPALFATYQILNERDQTAAARDAAAKYLAAYPDGVNAKSLRAAVKSAKTERPTSVTAPATSPLPRGGTSFERTDVNSTGHVQIFGVRFWSGEASTRVVIDLDRKVEIKQDRLQSPPRLFVDLIGTRLHPNLIGKSFPVGNAFLKQIRIGVNRENVVRVVIDFGEASSHNVFFLADPERLVIDVKGEPSRGITTAMASSSPAPMPGGTAAREVMESVEVNQPVPVVNEPTPLPATPEPTSKHSVLGSPPLRSHPPNGCPPSSRPCQAAHQALSSPPSRPPPSSQPSEPPSSPPVQWAVQYH